MKQYSTIDAYLSDFSEPHLKLLKQIRKLIQKAAPDAIECIKYGMPTYVLDSNLVHFAGNLNHIGFYPTPAPIVHFAKELKPYVCSKGAIQFPIDQPLPEALITKIVAFRVEACQQKTRSKSARICKKGHTYYKTSDCPVCPICAKEGISKDDPFAKLAAPARRALASEKITTLKKLASFKEEKVQELHGMGPSAMKQLKDLLKAEQLSFKK